MDEGGRLERLARRLLRHPLGGQLAQFIVDQRQKLLGRLRVALLDGFRMWVTSFIGTIPRPEYIDIASRKRIRKAYVEQFIASFARPSVSLTFL